MIRTVAVVVVIIAAVAVGVYLWFVRGSVEDGTPRPVIADAPKPVPPAKPFVFVDEAGRHVFAFGNAQVVDRGLELHLTDIELPCEFRFAMYEDRTAPDRPSRGGRTFWTVIPLGPEGLWEGHTIAPKAFVRDRLDVPSELVAGRTQLRIDAIDRDRIRGHIAVAKGDTAGEGSGDFNVAVCDPEAAEVLRKRPVLPVADRLAGLVLGRKFELATALVFTQSMRTLVFVDTPTTCKDLESVTSPTFAMPPTGTAIHLREFRASTTPLPAGGVITIRKPIGGGSFATTELDMPVGFALTLDGDLDHPGRVRGVLRGYSTHHDRELDLGGTFEAEVCPR